LRYSAKHIWPYWPSSEVTEKQKTKKRSCVIVLDTPLKRFKYVKWVFMYIYLLFLFFLLIYLYYIFRASTRVVKHDSTPIWSRVLVLIKLLGPALDGSRSPGATKRHRQCHPCTIQPLLLLLLLLLLRPPDTARVSTSVLDARTFVVASISRWNFVLMATSDLEFRSWKMTNQITRLQNAYRWVQIIWSSMMQSRDLDLVRHFQFLLIQRPVLRPPPLFPPLPPAPPLPLPPSRLPHPHPGVACVHRLTRRPCHRGRFWLW